MKIENKQYGVFQLIPEKETLEDISIDIIIASYELAVPFGLGYMRQHNTQMTRDMANKMLIGMDISHDYGGNPNKVNEVYMDYVFGRCCKTLIKVEDKFVKIRISERDRNADVILRRAKEILKGDK